VDLYLCQVRQPCLGIGDPIASVFTDPDGGFLIQVGADRVLNTLPIVAARISSTVVLRTPVFIFPARGASAGAARVLAQQLDDVAGLVVDVISEAAVLLLEEEGFENFSEQGLAEVVQAVEAANAASNFEDQTPEAAVQSAHATAAADPMVQMALKDNRFTPTPTVTPGPPGCVGDCDDSTAVTVDEVIKGVNITLGSATFDTCRQFDGNGDLIVTIDELILAVNNVLSGCH
jgi:hypothetical protein